MHAVDKPSHSMPSDINLGNISINTKTKNSETYNYSPSGTFVIAFRWISLLFISNWGATSDCMVYVLELRSQICVQWMN